MALTLEQIRAQAAVAAETADDMNVATKGGGGELLPAGAYLARLVEYVEYGKQPQEYNGQPKDPALEFRLGFEVHTQNGPVLFRTFDFSNSRNAKAKAFQLFAKLNYKGLAKTFYQLIDETYLITIQVKKSKAGKEYNELDVATVAPPVEALTKQPYAVPPCTASYLMFLWDHPTIEAWDALHIDGQFDDGKSKNFLQDKCLSAVDFPGSALEGLLLGSGKQFTRPAVPAPATAAPALPVAPVGLPDLPAPAAAVTAPAAPAMPAPPLPSALPALPAMPAPAV